jgi:16S rRNA G966 N2-methylase RsmD
MSPELVQFIQQHEHDDPAQLVLKHKEILGYPAAFVANQLDCRKRAKEKLPSWYANPHIEYPLKQNLEQCSSEATAEYKRTLLKSHTHDSLIGIDLTGGFGVDAFFLSRLGGNIIHVEPNENLSALARFNHEQLDTRNILHHTQRAEDFLQHFTREADWIYIDPSRKAEGKKVFRLSDCEPNVVELLPTLWSKTNTILIKAAPLLDIKEGLKQLPNTAQVHVVSVRNECREVLFLLRKNYVHEPEIKAIDLSTNDAPFVFSMQQEAEAKTLYAEPQEFLYEPNASILKAGAFKQVAVRFGLSKLAIHTHVYTHSDLVPQFPGRVFKVLGDVSAKELLLPDHKANVIVRNHPLTPDAIKKKYKLKDGGERYVLAFSGTQKKYLIVAERLN